MLAACYILSAVGAIVYLMGLMSTAWIMGSLLSELTTLGVPGWLFLMLDSSGPEEGWVWLCLPLWRTDY